MEFARSDRASTPERELPGRVSGRERRQGAALALTVLSGLVVVGLVDPAHPPGALRLLFFTCPLKEATGLLCAGCGSTRMFHELFHGNFAEAFGLNPLAVLIVPGVFLVLLHQLTWASGRRPPFELTRPATVLSALMFAVAFSVARNIGGF